MRPVAFQMWGPYRQHLIAEHCFYVEQAQKRLLSQFDNIHDEAEQAEREFLDGISLHFDPERHDPADFYEAAHDRSIEFYQLLSDMRDRTRLGVIAGMYHEWDKKLREWMVNEVQNWCPSRNVSKALWQQDIVKLFDWLAEFGWNVKTSLNSYGRLNEMRLVVNVFKHGDGTSFDELKQAHPDYLLHPLAEKAGDMICSDWLDHSYMTVTDQHVEAFSEAILAFWRAVPDNLFLHENLDAPRWFEKALSKGNKAII